MCRDTTDGLGKGAVLLYVANYDAVGGGDHKFVALAGRSDGYAPYGIEKKADYQQTLFRQCPAHDRGVALGQAASRGEDDGLRTLDKNGQHIALKPRVKSRNNALPSIAHLLCPVVDAQDCAGGVVAGANKGGFAALNNVDIAECGNRGIPAVDMMYGRHRANLRFSGSGLALP